MDTIKTVAEFVSENRIKADVEHMSDNPNMEDMVKGSLHYRVTLKMKRRRMTVPFSMGPAHKDGPTVEDVLMCLMSDAQSVAYGQTFEDWAGELGYDKDRRKAERTFKAVTKQYTALERFLGVTMLRELLGCEE